MQLATTLGLQIEAEFGIILCPYLALYFYLFAEDPNGAVTTFRAGSTFNVTFHLAYPHRVSTTSNLRDIYCIDVGCPHSNHALTILLEKITLITITTTDH